MSGLSLLGCCVAVSGCGIFGDCKAFDPMLILIVPMAVIAVLANLTAFARIAHCYKLLKKQ